MFADNLAIDIKVEHDDESQSTEITQNDDELQLDVKREVDEENFDESAACPSSSVLNFHFLDSISSPQSNIYEKSPPTATVISRKSRKDPYQSITCSKCGIKICSELEHQEHVMTVHDPNKKKNYKKLKPWPPAIDGKNEWMCTYCSKCFASKFDMLLHRKREHQKE